VLRPEVASVPVEAVVMAAGEGRRLRPVTERWPKPVLPIDGRPVIATLLRQLAAGGIVNVTVVVGRLASQIERLLDGGRPFGVQLRLARQPSADGSADAVLRALRAGAQPPLIVAAADTLFGPGDVGRFAERFATSGAPGALAVRRHPPPGPGRVAVRTVEGRVTTIGDGNPENPLAAAPLWGLRAETAGFLDDLPGPPFELAVAFRRAIASGLRVDAVEVGPTRDLTHAVDLMEENFPYLGALS